MTTLNHERDKTVNTNVMHICDVITNVLTIADRLKQARENQGLTQQQLADLAKVAQGTIANIENGIRKKPRELLNIAQALKVSPDWLANGPETTATTHTGVVRDQVASYGTESLGSVRTRLVPIKGAAKMGEGGFYDMVDDDGHVDAYSSDPQAYALRVKGDSMHPAIRHGAIVIVEPSGSCIPGEYVAIAFKDGRKMVKELVIDRLDEVVIESVNGNHRQTIDKADIEQIHPISSVVSASKWRSK